MLEVRGRQWVLASSNPGKIREFEQLLEPMGVVLTSQGALGIADADEPHPTFVENALAKARHASRLAGLPGLADDSGLCVPALGGAPGVHSARYAALLGDDPAAGLDEDLLASGRATVDAANNRKLVAAIAALRAGAVGPDRQGRHMPGSYIPGSHVSGSHIPGSHVPGSHVPGEDAAHDRAWYYCAIAFVTHPLDPCPILAEGVWRGRIVAEARGSGGFGYDAHFLVDGEARTAAELSAGRKNALSHRAQALGRLLEALQQRQAGIEPN